MVGSMSDRPCQAVTISGFFWSAKFFQMRKAPSSGQRQETACGTGWTVKQVSEAFVDSSLKSYEARE